jgi:hypothetical protein
MSGKEPVANLESAVSAQDKDAERRIRLYADRIRCTAGDILSMQDDMHAEDFFAALLNSMFQYMFAKGQKTGCDAVLSAIEGSQEYKAWKKEAADEKNEKNIKA